MLNWFLILWLFSFYLISFFFNCRFTQLFNLLILLFFFFFNVNFSVFEMNKLNFLFMLLSIWLIYLIYEMNKKMTQFLNLFLVIFLFAFCTKNFLLFFILFELSLIPTYFLVLQGSTVERSIASNYLILYTFMGSFPLLFILIQKGMKKTFFFLNFFPDLMKFKFILVISAFLMKLPIFFFHLWLPKAHVEASTEGSMILAGILLKLGSYGLLLCNPFLENSLYLHFLMLFGGIYAGFFSFIQMDLKAFMAYSSILHMSFMVYSTFMNQDIGEWGLILMSVGHGMVSANMFFLLSFMYSQSGFRNLLILKSSLTTSFFFMFLLSICVILNASAPFSINFFAELFLFMGVIPTLGISSFILMFFANVIGGILSIFFFMVFYHGSQSNVSYLFSSNLYTMSAFFSFFCISLLIFLNF